MVLFYTMQGTVYASSNASSSSSSSTAKMKNFFQLKDGTILNFGWVKSDNIDVSIWFPNKNNEFTTGKNLFYFMIVKNGVYPQGIENKNLPSNSYLFPGECSISSTSRSNGRACAAWVIYNENMDYLKCDGLSWEGKSRIWKGLFPIWL